MRSTKAKSAQYAVMLHGSNLILLDPEGNETVGGVWTWRYVRADSEAAAIAAAISLLERDEELLDFIRNPRDFSPRYEATRVVALERHDLLEGEGAGLVFYIDPDEPPGH